MDLCTGSVLIMKQKIVKHHFADECSQNWLKDSKDKVHVLLFKQAHVPKMVDVFNPGKIQDCKC